MADFINTIDVLGDDAVIDSIINRTITEFKDDTVTTVGIGAFYGCTKLATLELPNLESLPRDCNAFWNCTALTEIEFPNLVTTNPFENPFKGCSSIVRASFPKLTGRACFKDLKALQYIHIPLVTDLYSGAFRYCHAIEVIDLPSVTNIMSYCFCDTPSLKALILRSDTLVTVGNPIFEYVGESSGIAKGDGYIYVPRALLSDDDETKDYRRATNWSQYSAQFRALEDYTVDGTITGELDESKI